MQHVNRDKIRQGKPVTPASAPAWLDLDAIGQWVLNGYAAVIRRVADLALAGHGLHSIATSLNSEGVPSPGQYPPRAVGHHQLTPQREALQASGMVWVQRWPGAALPGVDR